MKTFTKNPFSKRLWLFTVISCICSLTATRVSAQSDIPLNYKYGHANEIVCPDVSLAKDGQVLLTVTGLNGTNIKDFLSKSTIQIKLKGQDYQATKALDIALQNGTAAGLAAYKQCIQSGGLSAPFDLNAYLALNGFEKFKFTPYLGAGQNTQTCEFSVSDKSKANAQNADVVKTPAKNQAVFGKSNIFIPTADMEKLWTTAKDLDKPILNGHTSYALEYDFGRYDPVKVWKRGKTKTVEYYSASDVKALRPKAYRDLLLSIRNFEPYRDSLSVSVDFADRNLEHAADFTSAYTNGINTGTANTPAATTAANPTASAADENFAALNLTDQFKELDAELQFYYQQKRSAGVIDVKILDNGVSYIKSRMTELLKVNDFSEAGIIKQAEDLATNSKYTIDADFTAAVRAAAASFIKVSRYNYFNNRDIFIQNRDAVALTLTFFRDGKPLSNLTETRKYNISNGFKIDFSLGLYGSFMKDNLYTTRPVSDTTFFTGSNGKVNRDSIVSISTTTQRAKIIRDNQGAFSMGPAVFSHIYWKTGSELNGGLTFGLSLDQTATPRYLVGGSLMLGLESRWTFTYGAAFGKVKTLASGLTEGQVVDLSNYPNSTLPTKDYMEVRAFFAVSWNFAGFNLGSGSGTAKH